MDFNQADALIDAIRSISIRHRALAGTVLAPLGLHTGQEMILLELDARGPRTQRQLATAGGCEPPTITGSARKLEAAGLVVRRPSPTDGRAIIVELSEKGRDLIPELKRAWRHLGELTIAGLTNTSLEQLTENLTDLASSIKTASGQSN